MQRPYFQEFEESQVILPTPAPLWILELSRWENHLFHPLHFSDKVSRYASATVKVLCPALARKQQYFEGERPLFESHSKVSFFSPSLFHGVSVTLLAPQSHPELYQTPLIYPP